MRATPSPVAPGVGLLPDVEASCLVVVELRGFFHGYSGGNAVVFFGVGRRAGFKVLVSS